MKLQPLFDNALFLQNWRERMRFAPVLSGVILTVVILVMIFLYAFINKYYPPDLKRVYNYPHLVTTFHSIAAFQGFLLLFFGTLSADKMTIRERSSGTLDFHRSSPSTRINQYLGLLLGTTSLEWCLFFGTLPVSLLLALSTEIGLWVFLKFYVALILSAVFFHTLAILMAVATTRNKGLSIRRFNAVHLIIILYLFSGLFMSELSLSSIYHLTWLPAYDQLYDHPQFEEYTYGSYVTLRQRNLYSLFGFRLPSFLLQLIVQLPLLILCIQGIIRKISFPERTVFSKGQSVIMVAHLLFLFVASSYSIILNGALRAYYIEPLNYIIPIFLYSTILLSIMGASSATPSRLDYLKGLIRAKKLKLNKVNWSEDHSSNLIWLMSFCLTVAVISALFNFVIMAPWLDQVICLAVLLCYVLFIGGMLEYYRLSRHHRKGMLFGTAIVILWVLLPIFSFLINAEDRWPTLHNLLLSPSPFSGMFVVIQELLGPSAWTVVSPFWLRTSFGINAALAAIVLLLGQRERQNCRRELVQLVSSNSVD